VAGQDGASGAASGGLQGAQRGRGLLELPISLSFAAIGQSAYRLLAGTAPLDYGLSGAVSFATSLPLLPKATLPVNLQGQVRLLR